MTAYLLLFVTAFGSATVLPFYSEVLFLGMLERGFSPWNIWLAATAGNTLGAVFNWYIALRVVDYSDRRWFPFKAKQMAKAQSWFNKYGSWTLLLSWMPVGGDALTVVAGLMRVPLGLFLVLVSVGKGLRYLVLILIGLGLFA